MPQFCSVHTFLVAPRHKQSWLFRIFSHGVQCSVQRPFAVAVHELPPAGLCCKEAEDVTHPVPHFVCTKHLVECYGHLLP